MKMFKDNFGKPSHTTSVLWIGFYVATIKLLVSGMDWGQGWKWSEFSGSDYAIVLGALGALYQSTKVIKGKFPNVKSEESSNQ